MLIKVPVNTNPLFFKLPPMILPLFVKFPPTFIPKVTSAPKLIIPLLVTDEVVLDKFTPKPALSTFIVLLFAIVMFTPSLPPKTAKACLGVLKLNTLLCPSTPNVTLEPAPMEIQCCVATPSPTFMSKSNTILEFFNTLIVAGTFVMVPVIV